MTVRGNSTAILLGFLVSKFLQYRRGQSLQFIDSQFRLDVQTELQISFTTCFYPIVKKIVKADFGRNEMKPGFISFCLGLDPAADASAFVRNPLLLIRFRFPSILAPSKEHSQYLPRFLTVISLISSSAFPFQRILYDESGFLPLSIKNTNIV